LKKSVTSLYKHPKNVNKANNKIFNAGRDLNNLLVESLVEALNKLLRHKIGLAYKLNILIND